LVKQAFIKVNPIVPIAEFISDRTIIEQNEFIRFTDVSTGEITTRLWKFTAGIPATSYDNNVNVAYANKGTYPVELIVSNEGGSKTMLKTAYVTVNEKQSTSINNIENLADFTVYPNPVKKGELFTVKFPAMENLNISIYDGGGRLIRLEKIDHKAKSYTSSLSVQSSYLITLTRDGKVIKTFKLIVN
jgi:PKD repeat protein